MKTRLLIAASALTLAPLAAPATAQHQHMPGMHMPEKKPAAKKPAPKKPTAKKPASKKAAAKKAPAKKAAAKKSAGKKRTAANPAAKKALPPEATAVSTGVQPAAEPHVHEGATTQAAPQAPPATHDHSQMQHGAPTPEPATAGPDHSQMDHSQMDHSATPAAGQGEHAGHGAAMTGALGPYAMTREASGTSWQPDTSGHSALHISSGDWTLMAHGILNLVYDHQGSPRGDDKLFPSGMLMGMARRPLGDGTLQLRAMVSPDPIMGKRGYPLLLATGETADGVEHLVDRQHPHDFFMELSGSVSQNIGPKSSVYLYAGLPGEPAFGPPAFMHREAIMDSPEAPISHHWLDSTHISFGVVTAGVVLDRVKIEASRFNGREPDQHRWDIETGPLDSTAVRVSWNPTRTLSLQGSWGHFTEPEQLEPGVDQKRLSASLLYAREVAPGWKLSGTLAWGRKSVEHHGDWLTDDAYVAELGLKHRGWSIFGRGEITENRELLEGDEHGEAFRVGKVSAGAVRDFRLSDRLSFGAGALASVNFVPDGLAPLYDGNNPVGAMGFVRLKLH